MYGVFKSTTDDSVTLSGPLKLENNTGIYSKDAYGDYQQLLNWTDSDIIVLGAKPVSLTGGQLTNITTVTNNTDAVSKSYVDNRTTDFIVDSHISSGTAGEWSWRKWNSGIFECWASHSVSLTADTQSGSNYYSTSNYIHLPIISHTTYNNAGAICEIVGGNSMMWAANAGITGGTPTGTPSGSNTAGTVWFRAMRSISLPSTGTFRIYVICKWSST